MIGLDIGVMIVLMLMIKQRGVLPSRLLLYAANPLILLYISGEGHLDVIQLFFLCITLYLILCQKFPATGFLMLGLAILSKYFALVAVLDFLAFSLIAPIFRGQAHLTHEGYECKCQCRGE